MKALSLWQPWASLIAYGVKDIETRSWAAPAGVKGTANSHSRGQGPRKAGAGCLRPPGTASTRRWRIGSRVKAAIEH